MSVDFGFPAKFIIDCLLRAPKFDLIRLIASKLGFKDIKSQTDSGTRSIYLVIIQNKEGCEYLLASMFQQCWFNLSIFFSNI